MTAPAKGNSVPLAARRVEGPTGRREVYLDKAALPLVTAAQLRRQLIEAGETMEAIDVIVAALQPFLADAPQPSTAVH